MAHRFNKRILKELENLAKPNLNGLKLLLQSKDTSDRDQDPRFLGSTTYDLQTLKEFAVEITGAEETVYANEKYILKFKIPDNYPIEAPEVTFFKYIPENEHVYSNGHICLSILYDQWSPALTIESICISIISLLSSTNKKKKPINDEGYCRISKNKSPKDFKWTYTH